VSGIRWGAARSADDMPRVRADDLGQHMTGARATCHSLRGVAAWMVLTAANIACAALALPSPGEGLSTPTETARSPATRTATPPPSPSDTPAPTPTPLGGGGWIAFSSDLDRFNTYSIFPIRPDGSDLRRLTEGIDPAFSPDGQSIAFAHTVQSRPDLYVIEVERGTKPRPLTEDWATEAGPVWSPDGQRIAFSSDLSGDEELYLISVDGQNRKRLTHSPGPDHSPAWSPDGMRLAFVSNRVSSADIFVLVLETEEVFRLTSTRAIDTHPSWSPDGSWIAFSSSMGNPECELCLNIHLMHPDGSDLRQLTFTDPGTSWTQALFPSWSPDGEMIVYQATSELYGVSFVAGKPQLLFHPPAPFSATQPVWSSP